MGSDSAWVVLKFGGTSVSGVANWRNIAGIVRERLATGARVLVVHSAVSGITDKLEKLLEGALSSRWQEALASIEQRHRDLAAELGVPVTARLERHFLELRQIAEGVALVGEVSERTRARIMATGELMATEVGARFLGKEGFDASWVDARTLLTAEERKGASQKASALSATCGFAPDDALIARLDGLTPVIVTQGFIANDADGHTVLLGRGGSDTSAAYLAAKLRAQRLEIWTDVPGMFSANPRSTPTARLLKVLHYDEAQEIATSGAKVLHPRCILPARQYQIPLWVYATQSPQSPGTLITAAPGEGAAQVKAVCIKKGVTLVAMDSPGMWHQVGFLADAFQVFKDHGLSVDLVSTSETNVTVSLDPAANTLDDETLRDLVEDLGRLCRVQTIGPCASVSVVGRNIRAILHQLGDAFELFEEQKVYLVSQAANDLNLTFVVDEDQGERLVGQLHELLIRPTRGDAVLGPTWQELFGAPSAPTGRAAPWWRRRRPELLAALGDRDCAFVYERESIRAAARALRGIRSTDRVLYAMKANFHPEALRLVHDEGLGIECVSRGELERAFDAIPRLDPANVLFTPNFAPRAEYAWAIEKGVRVTVDNLHALARWGALFRGREIFIRIDTGSGRGHHHHVRTAGAHSKFGIPADDLEEILRLAGACEARVVGLHAHPGSGVFDLSSWTHTAELLANLARRCRDVRILNVGGGLGVPDRPDRPPLDLAKLDAALAAVKAANPGRELWLEPGRYLVAEAGVMLARVTQTKSKGDVRYVGVATGMNSLIRPALYGAYHEIVNLTRLERPASEPANVVGPICESADFLGHDRLLPACEEGDVLLVANAGAYGRVMSSSYNLREPAEELFL
jgi:diaminopimelate decarboxylase/aspartate kinase